MNHKTKDANSSASCLQVSEQQYVRSISENPLIEDIFRFDLWGTEQGIDYLVGIYETTYDDERFVDQLVSLDGLIYKRGKDDDVIKRFTSLHDRLSNIWRHSRRKDKYTPGYFIRWGLGLADIFQISWLEDAKAKGLVPEKWLIRTPSSDSFDRVVEEKSLGKKEGYLLSIIAGLYFARYSQQSEETALAVQKDLDLAGINIDIRTIRRHLLAAIPFIKKPIADKKLSSK